MNKRIIVPSFDKVSLAGRTFLYRNLMLIGFAEVFHEVVQYTP